MQHQFACTVCSKTLSVEAPSLGQAVGSLAKHGWYVLGKPGQPKQYAHNLECRKQLPGYLGDGIHPPLLP